MSFTRESAASMVALQAIAMANHPRIAPGATARVLISRWTSHDHALSDADHLLRRVLEDTDPTSLDALEIINALVAIADANESGASI